MPGLLHAVANQAQVVLQSLAAVTATNNGTGLDVSDYEGLLAYTAVAPTVTGTPSIVFTLETSDTLGSGYTAVTGVASPAWTASGAANVYRAVVDRAALKRYVRSVMTLTGGTTPTVSGSALLVGCKKVQ